MLSQQTSQAQLAIEKAQSYWRHVYEIISGTQTEFAALVEAKFKQRQNDARAFIDSLAKGAPAGSETAVAAWKTFITTASQTAHTPYENTTKPPTHARRPPP